MVLDHGKPHDAVKKVEVLTRNIVLGDPSESVDVIGTMLDVLLVNK